MKVSEGRLFEFDNWLADEHIVLDFIRPVQISEVAFEPGGQIYEHTQRCHEITYIVSGEGFFYTNDEVMHVRRGDIHIIAKGDRHKIIAGPYEKLRYICLGFDFDRIPEPFLDVCRFYAASPAFVMPSEPDIRSLFDMLVNEFYSERTVQNGAPENIIKLILIKCFRCFMNRDGGTMHEKSKRYGNMTVYRITKYIDNNIYDVKSVREIAAALNFTENYISHTFKVHMGISLLAYIKKKKVEAAKGLIESRNMSFTEIAELLRFDSVQSFSRAFKQEYQKTPTQYAAERDEKTGG